MTVTINGTTGIGGVDGSAATPAVQGVDTNTGIFFPAADTIAFSEGGTEVMRITSSANVGIGTTSPTTMLQVAGSSSVVALKIPNIAEPATINATAPPGTVSYNVATYSVLYYTSNASANWTVNFRGTSTTSLDSIMAVNDVITVALLATQGATPYYNNLVNIDGLAVTPKYQGGSAWTSGNASGIDAYTYTIIKTASATFTVLASQTQYK